jgi:hypothetical protein
VDNVEDIKEVMVVLSDGGTNAGCAPVLAAANQAKGMGEGGTVGAPAAIANAVADAVRARGVSITRLPIQAESLRRSG